MGIERLKEMLLIPGLLLGNCELLKKLKSNWKLKCHCGAFFYKSHKEIVKRSTIKADKELKCSPNCGQPTKQAISLINRLIYLYKYRSKLEGHNFTLTLEEVNILSFKPCYYCSIPPTQCLPGYLLKYNGIDRIDSNLGYITNNCITACGICNSMKSNHSIETFIMHVKRIARQFGHN